MHKRRRIERDLAAMKNRDEIIREAYAEGFLKKEIHERSGVARTTIDRILKEKTVADHFDINDPLAHLRKHLTYDATTDTWTVHPKDGEPQTGLNSSSAGHAMKAINRLWPLSHIREAMEQVQEAE